MTTPSSEQLFELLKTLISSTGLSRRDANWNWGERADIYLNPYFVSALLKKIRNCATMPSSGLCPMRGTG